METEIKGLYLVEEVISLEEEEYLAEHIKSGTWVPSRSGRRVQVTGAWHDSNYKIVPGKHTPHPSYIKKLLQILKETRKLVPEVRHVLTKESIKKISSHLHSEIFINEYNPGDFLRPHFDQRTTYDECIFGISLLSDVDMTFGKKTIRIPRRSLYIMSGKARYNYKHSIKNVENYRLSITFRTIC